MALGAEFFHSISLYYSRINIDSKTYNIIHILGTKNPHDSDSGSGSDSDEDTEQQQEEVRLFE